MTIHYDPSALQYVGASSLLNDFVVVGSAQAPGTIRLLEASTGTVSPVTGTLDLLVLTFQALDQTATTHVHVSDIWLSDQYGNEREVSSGSGHTMNIVASTETVNKFELSARIGEADSALKGAKVLDPAAPRFGYYPQSAIDALNAALAIANTVYGQIDATQSQVDQASSALTQALAAFNAAANQSAVIDDLVMLSENYHATSSAAQWQSIRLYDFNHDGMLDIMDLASLARRILN